MAAIPNISGSIERLPRVILVVEDEAFLRSLIVDSLAHAGFQVHAVANAAAARRAIRDHDPDAMVIDINLGTGPSGHDLAEVVRSKYPEIGILFLTSLPDFRFIGKNQSKLDSDIAYLNKSMLTETGELITAIEAVLAEDATAIQRHNRSATRPLAELTNTQVQVLHLIADGKTNQQIAELRERTLGATENTITRLFRCLGIADGDANARVRATRIYLDATNLK